MKKLLLILLFAFPLFKCNAQTRVNFRPVMLDREIKSHLNNDDLIFTDIDELENSTEDGKFFLVQNKGTNTLVYIYIGRIYSCRADGCDLKDYILKQNSSEYFDYFILFNSEGIINSVRVYNYQATHGQEVSAKSWLRKFRGYNGEHNFTGKNRIDAIAGATISSTGIVNDISLRTKILKAFLER